MPRDWQSIDELPPERRQVYYSFGNGVPRLAGYPHVIAEQNRRFGVSVLQAVGASAGIWGEFPLAAEGGQPFVPPWSGGQAESFALWQLPANRYRIDEYLEGRDTEQFSMLIDAATPSRVLQRMDLGAVPFNDYYYYIDRVADWLNDLRWAYIPLEYEGELAIFGVGEHDAHLVTMVRELLLGHGAPAFRLTPDAESGEWSLRLWPE